MNGKQAATELPLDLLKPDPDNPRVITDEALAGLEASIEQHGDVSGLTWNETTGQFVAGHQRLTVLKRAGATSWRRLSKDQGVIVHPKTDERFYIRIVEWTPEQQRIANLVANNPFVAGEFTPAALEQLKALEEEAAFTALRLDELQKQLQEEFPVNDEPVTGNTDPDHVPDVPDEPTTKLGDLWLLGEHRLLCGDSTKPEDVARLLQGERPALGLHDPPYGIGIQHREGNIGGAQRGSITFGPKGPTYTGEHAGKLKTYPRIAGDDRPFVPAHLLNGADIVVLWGANHYADKLPSSASWLVWDKRDGLPSTDFSDAELAWCSKGGRIAMFRMMWAGVARPKAEDGAALVHPTQKPIALYRWVIEEKTESGDLVYDAYAGSGPTVLACEKLGRRARAMELEPAYCDVIVARWEAFTGKKAMRADPVEADGAAGARGADDEP
jgi:hypothetical protein